MLFYYMCSYYKDSEEMKNSVLDAFLEFRQSRILLHSKTIYTSFKKQSNKKNYHRKIKEK